MKILAIKLVLWSVQLVISLLLVLLNKVCHPHPDLFNHLLVKAVIKRQDDKLFDRKWKKCWKIAAKLTRENGETR